MLAGMEGMKTEEEEGEEYEKYMREGQFRSSGLNGFPFDKEI